MSTGYGPSNRLMFDGDEDNYELWECRFLAHMSIEGLKSVMVQTDRTNIDATKNEKAYSQLVQVLDHRSLSLIMRDAEDDGNAALTILRDHYTGKGKPRILTLYTQLCTLVKSSDMNMTDYVLKAEKLSNSLKSAGETITDSLLIAMVMKGLPHLVTTL